MGKKKQKKQTSITERVYATIVELHAKKGPLDINATRHNLKHKHGIDSGAKFNVALEQLIESGRIVKEGHTISPATPTTKIAPVSQSSNLIYGRVVKLSHDNLVFVPNDNSVVRGKVFLLNDKSILPTYENKLCTLELSPSASYDDAPTGFVRDILGDAGNPIAEYDAIAQSHGAIMSWLDPAVQEELKLLPRTVNPNDYNLVDEEGILRVNNNAPETIVDLRHLPFTSTDPKGCMDMDDVMYSTYDNAGNIVVYTAIADVTRYVKPQSEIGKRYIRGGFTFYASNRAYNILPPELSTGICSLHPNVPRLTFVIKTTIDAQTGLPIESKFMNALVESKEKFSYAEAQHIVDTRPDITKTYLLHKTKAGHALTKEELVVMNKYASDLISKGFSTRNSITFSAKNEYHPVFSEDGLHIVDMALAERYPYDKVVENFMVTANEESAKFALQHNIPIIFRVHDEPNSKKIDQAYEFFAFLHIPFDGDLSPSGTRRIVESVKGTYKENAVNNFLIRMQSKAKYSISTDPKSVQLLGGRGGRQGNNNFASQRLQTVNRHARNHALQELIENIKQEEKVISHFGLQSEHYSHTTAPIRRITDYVTHYNIKAYLNHTPMLPMSVVREIAEWANEREDEIIKAEREQHEFNSALYCEDRINEVMKGRISGFRSLVEGRISGAKDIMVIVENEETGVRVQIPAIEILASKYSHFNDVKISTFGSGLVTKGGKPLVTLCEEVTFKVAEASRVTRTVYASTNLTKDFTQTSFLAELQELAEVTTDVSQIKNPIFQRSLYEARTRKGHTSTTTKKSVAQTSSRLTREGVVGGIDEDEAEQIARHEKAKYKASKKGYGSSRSNRQAYDMDDYYFEQPTTDTMDDDDIM